MEQKFQYIDKQNDFDAYDYIRFSCADINGIPRGKIYPRPHAQKVMKKGVFSAFSGERAHKLH